jgi:NADH-quinone oxidoreductase subunit J
METLHNLLSISLILICLFVFIVDNPVHSVLLLILAFFNAAIILFLIRVEFLAIIFIIIYVGAIAILFLFVVMMLNVKIFIFDLTQYYLFLFLFLFTFSLQIFLFIIDIFHNLSNYEGVYVNIPNFLFDNLTAINILGQVLYNYYTSCFLLAGLVLLVAMIGAISLTLNFAQENKTEILHKQLARSENCITFFK